MSFNDHKLIDNSLGDTMLDILEEKRKGDFKMYGTTLVNLLGKYGNFEVDSNADGLADGGITDGWYTPTGSLDATNKMFGSYSQKLTRNVGGSSRWLLSFDVIDSHKYYVSGYIRTDTILSTLDTLIIKPVPAGTTFYAIDAIEMSANTWTRFHYKFTSPVGITAMSVGWNINTLGTYDWQDGFMAIDLTAAGALDPVRQAKYGVANWADLTAAQLEAEIPYFDSVMSVNVKDGTASELTIENRGKNIKPRSRMILGTSSNTLSTYDSLNDTYTFENIAGGYCYSLFDANRAHLYLQYAQKIKPNTSYVLSFDVIETTGNGESFRIQTGNDTFTTYHSFASTFYTTGRKVMPFTTLDGDSIYGVGFSGSPSDVSGAKVVIRNVQLEEGSAATDYVPPHTDSIIIPDTCELHSLEDRHDYVEYDADEEKLLYVSFIAREDKTTDGSGDFALTGAVSGSRVLVRDKTTGEVEWCTESEGSVHTSTISSGVEIWYIRATPTSTAIYGLYSGNFLKALKNNIVIDSNLPVAMKINDSNQSGYVITQNFME